MDLMLVGEAIERSDSLRRQFLCNFETPIRIDYRGLRTFGTADVAGLSPDGSHLLILDWKYGKGVRVDAEENPAMILYALGYYQTVLSNDEQETVKRLTLSIVQPRLFSGFHFSTWEIDRERFLAAAQRIVEASWEIEEGRGVFRPSEHACVFCPAKKICSHAVKSAPPFASQHVVTEEEAVSAFKDAFGESIPADEIQSFTGTQPGEVVSDEAAARSAFDQAFGDDGGHPQHDDGVTEGLANFFTTPPEEKTERFLPEAPIAQSPVRLPKLRRAREFDN